jgi:NitT/TauT family transport system substrate-binding protein
MIRFWPLLPSVIVGALLAGCSPEKPALRVGHFPNLTHAQALVGHASSRKGQGWLEKHVGPGVEVRWLIFNAGPSAVEALVSDAIDLAYVGPNPAINAHLRCDGEDVRIVAGASSGGSALVVRRDGTIRTADDLRGKRVATPQLGNTQDVAARAWLQSHGLRITLTGGDATVLPTANPDQIALFKQGEVDAVWTVEPWVSRLVHESDGRLLLDESELWPETGGRYVTAHVAASARFVRERPDLLERFLDAHVELTQWILEHPEVAKAAANEELREETGRPLAPEILDAAWARFAVTHDPLPACLVKSAADAHRVGFFREKPDLSRIHALESLNAVLRRKGFPEVPWP